MVGHENLTVTGGFLVSFCPRTQMINTLLSIPRFILRFFKLQSKFQIRRLCKCQSSMNGKLTSPKVVTYFYAPYRSNSPIYRIPANILILLTHAESLNFYVKIT